MQQGALLVETSVDGYRPLGAFGQPVHKSYVQLRAAVERRLNSRCANLFARPQFDERGGTIRWMAPIPGEPRRWRDLAPEEQAERALDLQIMRGEFENYLAELRQAGTSGGGEAFASVLDQALKTPNDGHLHLVGDQPVMTFWGFTELNGESFEALAVVPPPDPIAPAAGAAAQAATGGPGEGPHRRFPAWLIWLLPFLLLLLLLLLWWLFWPEPEAPLGEDPVPGDERLVEPDEDPGDEDVVVPVERIPGRRPIIRDRRGNVIEYRRLRVDEEGRVVGPDDEVIEGVTPEELGLTPEGELPEGELPEGGLEPELPEGEADEMPPAEMPLEPPPGEGEEPLPPEGEAPLPEPDTGEPPLPEDMPPEELPPEELPPEELPPEELPPEEQPGEEESEPLALPPLPEEGAEEGTGGEEGASRPADFLEGKWRSRSALADEEGNRLDQTYEFDEEGKGRSVIRRSDGVECSAPAEARMEGGKLRIRETENPTCADGQKFERSETVCDTDASGQTRCRGKGYNVQIERSK